MKLPPLLSSFIEDFEIVYKKRHNSHAKLNWLHILSRVDIKYLCFKNNENYSSSIFNSFTDRKK